MEEYNRVLMEIIFFDLEDVVRTSYVGDQETEVGGTPPGVFN